MKLSSRAYALYEAFDQPGCPVCRLASESVHHYLGSLIYEYITKAPTHLAVRAARGFCPTHAWHVQDELNATAQGVALLYEGLIRTLLDEMGAVAPDGGRAQVNRAANALKPQGECPACEHRATVEDHLLRNLLEAFDQDEFAAGFERSAGLCLPHLRMALERSGHTRAKAQLLHIQQSIWARLQADLKEYIRKQDYRFADEDMGAEGNSARRAIEQFSGKKGTR